MHRFSEITCGLVIFLAASGCAVAADIQQVSLEWRELPALMVGHELALTLPDGVRVQGDALAVADEGITLDVRKTSDKKAHPKGQAVIARGDVSAIDLNNKMGRSGRFIGKTAGGVGGTALGVFVATKLAEAGVWSPVGLISVFAGSVGAGTILGYFAGRHFDRRITRITVRQPEAANIP